MYPKIFSLARRILSCQYLCHESGRVIKFTTSAMKFDMTAPNEYSPFRRIPAGKILENVLKERLPYSALLYNMMKYEDIPDCDMQINWFTLNGSVCSDTWIVAVFWREENWHEYIISPPSLDSLPDNQIEDFGKALASSTVVNWKEEFIFTGVYATIVPVIKQVIQQAVDKEAGNDPCYQFYMSPEEAAAIDMQSKLDDAVLQPLDVPAGAKFMADTWKYTAPGSYEFSVKQISKLPSSGIYINKEPVSGVLLKRHGALGMLYTKTEYRNKGYGSIVMKSIMKQLGQLGFYPCSHVDVQNEVSKAFHEKLEYKVSHIADFVFVKR